MIFDISRKHYIIFLILMLRKATQKDVYEIAQIHSQALPHELLTKLGEPFLHRLYRSATNNSDCLIIIALDKEKIIGSLWIAKNSGSFYKKFLLENPFFILKITVLSTIKNIHILKDIASTAKYVLSHKEKDAVPEILAFVIDETYQRQGIGSLLLKKAENTLLKLRYTEYNVKTTAKNKKSNSFYKKNGFIQTHSLMLQNRKWVQYNKKIKK